MGIAEKKIKQRGNYSVDIYEGSRIRVLKLGVTHPFSRDEVERVDSFSSLQTGVLKIRGEKVVACPIHYKYSRIAEREKRVLPLMSVIGIAEHDNHVLIGMRSKDVRFPNYMGAAPSGHVEFGLTPQQAIEMELHEELGRTGKTRLMGAQLSPLYFGLIYKIELESSDVKPSWEWSNLFWIQKEKLGQFLIENGKLFGPGFASSFLLYLNKEVDMDPAPIAEKHGWRIRMGKIRDLEWNIRRNPDTYL